MSAPAEGRSWLRRRSTTIELRERLRPVELPLLAETKRRIFGGDVAGALRYAYPLVLDDLQRAYGVQFPPDWTHEEILRGGLPPGAGPIGEFLPRLYRLYGQARYGSGAELTEADGLAAVELLRSIYAYAPMWRLYAWQRRRGLGHLFPPRVELPVGAPAPPAGPLEEEP